MSGFILPPPVGVSNEMYEAYPQDASSGGFQGLNFGGRSDPGGIGSSLIGSGSDPGNYNNTLSSGFGGNSVDPALLGSNMQGPASALGLPGGSGGFWNWAFGNSSAPGTQNASVGATIAQYFMRGVIVVLGFIFVAVGLHMFRVDKA